ncbi:MAG TPA: hypothetical protein VFP37_03745 [Steroidobacteraceae bacterium]|nr:hypothetical protein [Steroidobacteraceae bacterium]
MWRKLRIGILLFFLAVAAYSTLHDRLSTTSWDETLWIGVFPINADDGRTGADYIARLDDAQLADIERFINQQAHAHGVSLDRPVRVDLYPQVREKPPPHDAGGNIFTTMWWSLKLRLYARRNAHPAGRAPPTIRIFVLYHDPSFDEPVPHSVGLQKGLVGVVHAFADASMTRTNNVVIAHEILHTLGATDKYELDSLAPLYPAGYAEPDRDPLYPQVLTEIMAGRRAVDEHTFEMPETLDEVVVGAATAAEIRWSSPP